MNNNFDRDFDAALVAFNLRRKGKHHSRLGDKESAESYFYKAADEYKSLNNEGAEIFRKLSELLP